MRARRRRLGLLAFVLAALLPAAAAQAASTQFTQAVNNDWMEPGNWTAGVPGAGDTAVLLDGTSAVLSASSETIAGLTFPGSASLTLDSATLDVDNAAGLAGTLTVTNFSELKGLPPGTFTLRVRVRLATGKVVDPSRQYRTCAPGASR